MLLYNYIIIFYFLIIGFFISFFLFFLAYLLAPKYFYTEKISIYECGFQPFYSSRLPFDVHFYIIAILFLIFDIEIVFIYPWVASNYYSGLSGFLFLFLFIFILSVGFIYEWKKNILDWSKNL